MRNKLRQFVSLLFLEIAGNLSNHEIRMMLLCLLIAFARICSLMGWLRSYKFLLWPEDEEHTFAQVKCCTSMRWTVHWCSECPLHILWSIMRFYFWVGGFSPLAKQSLLCLSQNSNCSSSIETHKSNSIQLNTVLRDRAFSLSPWIFRIKRHSV